MTQGVDGIDVATFFRRGASSNHDKIILSSQSRELTGNDALNIVARLSHLLRINGIRSHDRIHLATPSLIERSLLYWAVVNVSAYPILDAEPARVEPNDFDRLIANRTTTTGIPNALAVEDLFAAAAALDGNFDEELRDPATPGEDSTASYVTPSPETGNISYGARSHRNIVYTGLFGTFAVNSDRDQSIIAIGEIDPTTFEVLLFSSLVSGAHVQHSQTIDWSLPWPRKPDTWVVTPAEIARLQSTHPDRLAEGNWIVPVPAHQALASEQVISDFSTIERASERIRPILVDPLNGIVAEYDFEKKEWANFVDVELTVTGTPDSAPISGQNGILRIRSAQASHALENLEGQRGFYTDGWARPGLSITATGTGFRVQSLAPTTTALKTLSPDAIQWVNGLDVVSLLRRSTLRHRSFPAIQVLDRSLTHGEVRERTEALARELRHVHGIQQGDRVALLSRNTVEFGVLYLALNWLGAIFVPLNFRLKPGEVAYVLKDSGAKLLVYDEEFGATAQEAATSLPAKLATAVIDPATTIRSNPEHVRPLPAAEPVPPDEKRAAAILYTAGTTGFPKGAVRSNRNVIWFSFLGLHSSLRIQRRPTHLITTPMFHIAGHEPSIIGSFATGGFTLILNEFNVDNVLRNLVDHRVASLFVPPTIGFNLLDQIDAKGIASSLTNFRYWSSASAPLPGILLQRIRQTLPWVQVGNTLGMTETGSIARYIVQDGTEKPPGCIGRATPAAEVSIVNASGEHLPPGFSGEIVVRSPQVVAEYWNNQKASAESLRGGWFHGGDVGEYDDDRDIEIKGRLKEMIITGGENVYAAEIENVLLGFPEVKEAAVFGRPDPKWGESVNAAIVVRDGMKISENEIIRRCRDLIAHYKCPKRVAFLDTLPRNPIGKVTKFAIEI